MSDPVQTTYTGRIGKGVVGQPGGGDNDIRTGICETAAGIAFGLACSQGTGEQGAVLGGTAGAFLGVSVRDITLGAQVDVYPHYSNMGLLHEGQIFVKASADAIVDDPVSFDGTTGAISNTGGQTVKGARWVDTTKSGEVGRIELMARND